MIGPTLVFAALLAGAPPDIRNPSLIEGIDLYDASDFAGALQALTRALDRPGPRREQARIHLYIGLIQQRFKLQDDAEASFTKALSLDRGIKLPKGTGKGAKQLFQKVQDRLGLEERKKRTLKREEREDATRREEPRREEPRREEPPRPEPVTRSSTPAVALELVQATPPAPQPAASAPPRAALVTAVTAPPEDEGPIGGWVGLGVGVASAAAGVTLGVLAQVNGSAAKDEPYARRQEELYQTAVSQRTFAFVAFGVSGAALLTSAILFLTD